MKVPEILGEELEIVSAGHPVWHAREIEIIFRYKYKNILFTNPYCIPYISKKLKIMREGIDHYEFGHIGFIYWNNLKLAYMSDIYVSLPLRRQKFASVLFNVMEEYLRENGIKELCSEACSDEGLRFMLSKGMEVIEEIKNMSRLPYLTKEITR